MNRNYWSNRKGTLGAGLLEHQGKLGTGTIASTVQEPQEQGC